MYNKLFLPALALIALAATSLSGNAAGLFPGFPIAGQPAYCGSTVNGSCVATVPAGPGAITGAETLPADTNLAGGVNPQTELLTTDMLGSYAYSSAAGASVGNLLIGGDMGTNLWQRGTTHTLIGSIDATAVYGPDRFAAWGIASSTVQVDKETAAADITKGYTASVRVARTGAAVGQVCFAQEISSANTSLIAGQSVEVDFHALAGSGFSAASGNLAVYVVTGTGTDEGIQKMAFSLNGSGSGSTPWTGGAKTLNGALVSVPGGTAGGTAAWNRYTAYAAIPAGTTEAGVAICWTPVGASPSSDYVELTGIQLVRANTTVASPYVGTAQVSTAVPAQSFQRRNADLERSLQLAYYWQNTEAASSNAIYGVCQGGAAATTAATCIVTFPVAMRAAPTLAYTQGTIVATVGTAGAASAVTALAIATAGATQYSAELTATATSVATITGFLEAGNSTGGGKVAFSAEL